MFFNIAYAATPQSFEELINFLVFDLLNPIIFLLGSIAFLVFFWGVARYIFSAGNDDAKEYGRNIMLYGIIALFMLVSLWGLAQIVKNTFFKSSPTPTNPGDDPVNVPKNEPPFTFPPV